MDYYLALYAHLPTTTGLAYAILLTPGNSMGTIYGVLGAGLGQSTRWSVACGTWELGTTVQQTCQESWLPIPTTFPLTIQIHTHVSTHHAQING